MLKFEQVFVWRSYFNSVYIIPVGMMLFSNFSADVNLNFLICCSIVLTKLRLCIVTKIQAVEVADVNTILLSVVPCSHAVTERKENVKLSPEEI